MMPTLNRSILQAKAIDFSYFDEKLFNNFSATITQGVTLVRGGDGCGKSTLLKLLAAALPVKKGQLLINCFDLQTQPDNYKSHVFWAEPRSDAFDQLTALDYFERQRSSYTHFNDATLADIIAGLGLLEHLHKQLFMLSTGSKRKVFLAAALAANATVTLLDEPFAALDAASISFVLTWLQRAVGNSNRACVIADYVAPQGLQLAQVIDLGD